MPETVGFNGSGEIWVDDGHVFFGGQDGATLRLTPETAIRIGRRLEAAGTESFINKVLEGQAKPGDLPKPG